jgi:CDP-4-dehydro-6-deoxyglucose reductase
MAFTVQLANRDVEFDVADDESVLSAGLRQGLALPFGCQTGGCGSCRVRCIQGRVDYAIPPHALSPEEVEAGYVLMCLARPATDLVLDLHQPPELESLRPRTLPARVIEKKMLAHDVVGLWLKLPREEGNPFRWLPGQYIDFLLADGRRRSFSIANAWQPGGPLELHLRITPNGRFAHYVQQEMPERAILRFEGPLGAFYLREDSDRPVILMAGGTGLAPIKAMLEHALASNAKRRFHLFRGVRSRRDLYLDELPRQWATDHASRFAYTPVLSEPDADWRGESGFVHEVVLKRHPQLTGHEVYMSGPPVMVQAGKRAFVHAGLDADHLFYDSFDYAFETWPALG